MTDEKVFILIYRFKNNIYSVANLYVMRVFVLVRPLLKIMSTTSLSQPVEEEYSIDGRDAAGVPLDERLPGVRLHLLTWSKDLINIQLIFVSINI